MTKHPQTELGYFVDGEVVRRKPPPLPKLPEVAVSYRKTSKKKIKRMHRESIRGLRNKLLLRADKLEALQNYSKQGLLDDAIGMILSIPKAFFCFGSIVPFPAIQLMARCLVAPGHENRSALYNAAYAGHVSMVQIYLALIALSRVSAASSHRGRKNWHQEDLVSAQTFHFWLNTGTFGFMDFFGQAEFASCILNALNVSVKTVFTLEKNSVMDMRRIVENALQRELELTVPVRTRVGAHTKHKPTLRMDYDVDIKNDKHSVYCQKEHHYHRGHVIYESDESETRTATWTDEDIFIQIALINDATQSIPLPVAEMDETCQSLMDEDWSEVNSADTESFAYGEDDYQIGPEEWSLLSDVDSVKSIGTDTFFSYSDALRFGKPTAMNNTLAPICEKDSDEKISCEVEMKSFNENATSALYPEDTFDADFIVEGVKQCCGGKVKFRFKGNSNHKLRRWRRCDKQRVQYRPKHTNIFN